MKHYLMLWIVILLPLSAQPVLSVEEAIAIGLEKNYSIRIARNAAEIARNNKGLGRANFLPSLDASGGFELSRFDQETNSPFSFGTSTNRTANGQLSITWTLFDGFRMFADRGRYQALARAGEEEARNTIENLVVNIMSAYFNLVQQEQLLQVAQETRDISRLRLQKEELRRDFGGASSVDLLNARVVFNADQSACLNQELQVEIARKDLNLLLARNPSAPLTVEEEIYLPPFAKDFETLQSEAMERNSTLLASRWNHRAAEDAVGLAASAYLPRISFGATYGYTDLLTSSDSPRFPEDISTQNQSRSVGLTLSWNLFDGFRTQIERENAKISARSQSLALEQAKLELAGLLREIYLTYQKRIELAQLEAENAASARQNLAVVQERYRMGAATSLEFRDAQVNLARARTSLIAAKFQARISRLELDRMSGKIAVR